MSGVLMMDKLEESKGEPRTMNMPGFTAEASLNRSSQRYLRAASAVAFARGEGVVPQATAVPDWIIDFYNATGGGPGIDGGGGGGGSYQTVQECLNKAEDGYNACRQYCYIQFGDSPSNWYAKQRCVADCSSAYTVAKGNCYRS
jgi:hypothetical protein